MTNDDDQSLDDFHRSLDDFLQDHAKKSMPEYPKVGKLYNVSLPSNFTGMQVSVVHLRSSTVWANGANLGHFRVPPRIVPKPNVTSLDIIFSNLGNWSSYYYNIPNYAFVTPILGFGAYGETYMRGQDGHITSTVTQIELPLIKPIMVTFPSMWLPHGKCVKFYSDGMTRITNMSLSRTCEVWGQGYFAIVVQAPPSSHQIWKLWVAGIGVGSIGFLLCVLVLFKVIRFVEKKKIQKMEKESEKSEVLDTKYVGHSRMPCAFGIRTQPVLENDYFP